MKSEYRAWDYDAKKMLYCSDNLLIANNSVILELSENGYYPLANGDGKRFDFMQHSGLIDESGNDLYVNDLIENGPAVWQVIFNSGCFCAKIVIQIYSTGQRFVINGNERPTEMALRAIKGKQLIGNIHEHPHLLNV